MWLLQFVALNELFRLANIEQTEMTLGITFIKTEFNTCWTEKITLLCLSTISKMSQQVKLVTFGTAQHSTAFGSWQCQRSFSQRIYVNTSVCACSGLFPHTKLVYRLYFDFICCVFVSSSIDSWGEIAQGQRWGPHHRAASMKLYFALGYFSVTDVCCHSG